jgi:hypothetical protein
MKILHIGDFRNPDGANWSTNIEANITGAVSGAAEPVPDQPQTQTTRDVLIRPPPGGFPQPQRLLNRMARIYG